jgi:hypothetical protein
VYPHRIRLRGPWEVESPALTESASVRLNWAEHGLTGFAGRVRFRRRFGLPRRIDAHERVWITGGATGPSEVWLNDIGLGRHDRPGTPFEFEVRFPLRDRNELVIEVESATPDGGLTGEVALEIRCAAYLRAVEVVARPVDGRVTLTVAGEAVGECERPLDLYVLLNDRNVAYQTVVAKPGGEPFDVRLDPHALIPDLGAADNRVRVELVNGATVWYALERVVTIPAAG